MLERTEKKIRISGKNLFNAIVIIIALVVLAIFSLSDNGLTDLINNIANMNVPWIIAALLCNALNLFIDMYLIYILTKATVPDFKLSVAFRSSMVGQFFSAVTPFSTGGQPMQIYYMAKKNVKPGISTSMLIQKFLVYQSTLTAYSLVAIILLLNVFKQEMNGLKVSFAFFGFGTQAFVIVLLLVFSFNKKITHACIFGVAKLCRKIPFLRKYVNNIEALETQLETFHKCNHDLFKDRKLLVKSYAATAIQLTVMFIIPYCIYRSFNLYGSNSIEMICSQAFVTMTSCFMPLPGAAGASELSFLGFFSSYFSEETLKSAVLLWRIITYYGVILFTAPFSRLGNDDGKKEATFLPDNKEPNAESSVTEKAVKEEEKR